jgi:hypothetical protein
LVVLEATVNTIEVEVVVEVFLVFLMPLIITWFQPVVVVVPQVMKVVHKLGMVVMVVLLLEPKVLVDLEVLQELMAQRQLEVQAVQEVSQD